MVDPRFDWGVTRVTPNQFKRQVEHALNRGFTFCTLSEYIKTGKHAGAEKQVAICFDDGFESVYRYALPVMRAYGLRATVFLCAGYVGQFNSWDYNFAGRRFAHMDWDQAAEFVHAGWEIGSHGMTHRDLTRLSDFDLETELTLSKTIIERRLGVQVELISYPFGNTNDRVWQMCKTAGYQFGFVMGRRRRELPSEFVVRRQGVYLFDSMFSYNQKLLAKNKWFFNFVQQVMDFCSDGTVMVKQGFVPRK